MPHDEDNGDRHRRHRHERDHERRGDKSEEALRSPAHRRDDGQDENALFEGYTPLEQNAGQLQQAIHTLRKAAKAKLKHQDEAIAEQRELRRKMRHELDELDRMEKVPLTESEEREMRPLLEELRTCNGKLKTFREKIRILNGHILRANQERAVFADQLHAEEQRQAELRQTCRDLGSGNADTERSVDDAMKDAIKSHPELQTLYLHYMTTLNRTKKINMAMKQVDAIRDERDRALDRVTRALEQGRRQSAELDELVHRARAQEAASGEVFDGNVALLPDRGSERQKIVHALHSKCDVGADAIMSTQADLAACLQYPESKLAHVLLGMELPAPEPLDVHVDVGGDGGSPIRSPSRAWRGGGGRTGGGDVRSFVDTLIGDVTEHDARTRRAAERDAVAQRSPAPRGPDTSALYADLAAPSDSIRRRPGGTPVALSYLAPRMQAQMQQRPVSRTVSAY